MPKKPPQTPKGEESVSTGTREKGSSGMSEYERKRLDNIKKNQELMLSLGISSFSMDQEMQDILQTSDTSKSRTAKRRHSTGDITPKTKKAKAPVTPRSSSRLKGIPAPSPEAIQFADFTGNRVIPVSLDKVGLMDASEYWNAKSVNAEYISDGHFKGWVKPEVAQKFNIDPTEAEYLAKLEAADGGKKRRSSAKRSGWSDAKSASAAMLKSNPNEYFFRHCAPGEQQWMGEWEPEEIEAFLSTVKQFGCGDRWGLFSSYVPHRVGYQCANFYRQVLLAEGRIVDPNYKISSTGKAIYVGNRSKSMPDDE